MSAQDVLARYELREKIKEAGIAAFAEIDCTKISKGVEDLDAEALAEEIFPLVLKAEVESLGARSADALIRGDLTAKVLPHLTTPDDPEWNDLDEVGKGTWAFCDRKVWAQTNPNFTRPVQRWVKAKGFTMCRTKVSAGRRSLLDAVYVTRDLKCIQHDFDLPLKTNVRNEVETWADNIAFVMDTHPEHAKVLTKDVESGMKEAANLAKARLALTAGTDTDTD